jgi:hypothetical protein
LYENVPATVAEVVLFRSVIVVSSMVAGSIASLNVMDMTELIATFVAPLAGDVERTVGGVSSGAATVVNPAVKTAASAFPAASFAPVETVIVYPVLNDRAEPGVKVAVLLAALYVTVPATAARVEVFLREIVPPLIVAGSIGSLKTTLTVEFTPTPAVASVGKTAVTPGGASSSVVNDQT